MKRFVDLRKSDVGYRFAWYDTVYDEFETHGGEQAWDAFSEFAAVYAGEQVERYRGLTPQWALDDDTRSPMIRMLDDEEWRRSLAEAAVGDASTFNIYEAYDPGPFEDCTCYVCRMARGER